MKKVPTFFFGTLKIVPILEVEIKISESVKELCIIYSGQTAEEVAEKVVTKHALGEEAKKEIVAELERQFKSLNENRLL